MSAYEHTAYRNDLTPEERARYVERVKEMFAAKRARGEIEGAVAEVEPVAPEETLDELEQDANAGRVLKWDLRLSPDEKLRWNRAALALGLTASEFVRDCVNTAAAEILADEGIPAPLLR